jgi:hypothetical protein
MKTTLKSLLCIVGIVFLSNVAIGQQTVDGSKPCQQVCIKQSAPLEISKIDQPIRLDPSQTLNVNVVKSSSSSDSSPLSGDIHMYPIAFGTGRGVVQLNSIGQQSIAKVLEVHGSWIKVGFEPATNPINFGWINTNAPTILYCSF